MVEGNKDVSAQNGKYDVAHPRHGEHGSIVVDLRGYTDHENSRDEGG